MIDMKLRRRTNKVEAVKFRIWECLCLCLISFILGCGSNKKLVEMETSSLKPLSVLFGRHISMNQGRPPADEASFKAFIQALPPSELEAFGVKDLSTLFISNRDHKPYVIRYGGATSTPGGDAAVVVFEQEGLNGKRYIATSLGEVREVDAAEFESLVGKQ